jgi:hypothetical protein
MSTPIYVPNEYRTTQDEYGPSLFSKIRSICLLHLVDVKVADVESDLTGNTDIIVKSQDIRISCRIRSAKYFHNPETRIQFTLRYWRKGNIPSEYSKIVRGKGDYLFYGFSDKEELLGWFILNLCKLREVLPYTQPLKVVTNPDGSSIFHVYSLLQFPKSVITVVSEAILKTLASMSHEWKLELHRTKRTS